MTAQHTNVKDHLLKEGRIVEEKELFKTTYRGKELKLVRLAIQKNGETKYKYIGYWDGKPLPTRGNEIFLPKELLENPNIDFNPYDNPWIVQKSEGGVSLKKGFTDEIIQLVVAGKYLFEATTLRDSYVNFPPMEEIQEEVDLNHEINFKKLVKEHIISENVIEKGMGEAFVGDDSEEEIVICGMG